jgi:uncharacterized spore protein YtfJ
MDEIEQTENPEEELFIPPSDQSIGVVQDTLDTFLAAGSVEAVYGSPVEQGETLIIPAAEVLSAMGFGVGSGTNDASEASNEGGGGGGGGYVFSRPVAVVIASPEGVRIEPVVDVTKIALAGLTTGAFMLSMFLRLLRPPRRL